MKDIEWLKAEVKSLFDKAYELGKMEYYESEESIHRINSLIDQLDEPEVLSQEWIDSNSINASSDGVTEEYVHVDDLQSLLVPTLSEMETVEITEEQVMEWLDNNEFYCHATAETVLANAVDKGELGYYGTKYSVVEKPVIPKYVAEYLDFAKSDVSLMRVLEIANRRDELPKWEKEYDWISVNDEAFARAWLDGYEVDKEKLYYIKFSENQYAQRFDESKIDSILTNDKAIAGRFTEEQIKKMNPNLMALAVEVME